MIFDTISYAPWIAIIFQCMNTRMAFSWTFIDLFIILMSCALTARFNQINQRIELLSNLKVTKQSHLLSCNLHRSPQVKDVKKWKAVNEDYNRLCTFCTFLDDKISWLVLVSFFNNFYFIIFQVHASLTLIRATDLEITYYFISLGLLVSRIVSICLYCNRVHETSKMPMDIFAAAPKEIFNKEVRLFIYVVSITRPTFQIIRLIDSCKYQTIGITGKRIFLIKKNLILKVKLCSCYSRFSRFIFRLPDTWLRTN
jgi:hypothetical protein